MHVALRTDGDETLVRAAETAGITFVTITGDTGPDPGVLAAHLARRTTRIGLLPQLHPAVTEPFHLATQLASLDHASNGRAGWLTGTGDDPALFAAVGEPRLTGDDLRAEIADVIEAARLLWDSWQDDAIIRDTTTGRFLDPGRVHHVDFTGTRFTIAGPLITPRPPQGQVIVAGPDTLGAAAGLDLALIAAGTIDEITARTTRARDTGVPLVFADLTWPVAPGLLDRLAGVTDGVLLHDVTGADLPTVAAATGPRPPARATLRDTLGLPRPANRFTTV